MKKKIASKDHHKSSHSMPINVMKKKIMKEGRDAIPFSQ